MGDAGAMLGQKLGEGVLFEVRGTGGLLSAPEVAERLRVRASGERASLVTPGGGVPCDLRLSERRLRIIVPSSSRASSPTSPAAPTTLAADLETIAGESAVAPLLVSSVAALPLTGDLRVAGER